MALIQINTTPTRRELRQFAGIWFPAAWALIGWLVWKRTHSLGAASWVWIPSAAASVVGYAFPALARPVFVAWMYAAYPVGFVVSHVVVGVIFFLVITPLGVIMRLAGRDPMQRRFDPSVASYWTPHTPGADRAGYFRLF